MLQKHLGGPFAVNGGELLLSLDSVVVDAEKLALRSSAQQLGSVAALSDCSAGAVLAPGCGDLAIAGESPTLAWFSSWSC